jgi:polyketide biosynthesis 3-hydroxy-3-methylglutaryl-CoA synthase-like enzyme PksG
MEVGIEKIGVYLGTSFLDINVLADRRNLDKDRMINNLIIREKSVAMPFEDPVSNAINAGKRIIDQMSKEEIASIEMVITCTESGFDMAKSMSTLVHRYLELPQNCRLFEIKNACYACTAGLQMGINTILSNTSKGGKVLVIATDIYRMFNYLVEEKDAAYYEPNTGAGAIALLLSDKPDILTLDVGANGFYGQEVWDSSQPKPDFHIGNADLSMLSYMDAVEGSYREYVKRVDGVLFGSTFDYFTFHTPFVGMVKGAHRMLTRKFSKVSNSNEIDIDYSSRVEPGTEYCQRVGNIMGGSLYLSLISLIDRANLDVPKRVGLFSYGSGCAAEFFSGVITKKSKEILKVLQVQEHLDNRYALSFEEYESLFEYNENLRMGTKSLKIKKDFIPGAFEIAKNNNYIILDEIKDNYERIYRWMS